MGLEKEDVGQPQALVEPSPAVEQDVEVVDERAGESQRPVPKRTPRLPREGLRENPHCRA
eukprot:11221939-Lingulodinium_polyedra.AAC.1